MGKVDSHPVAAVMAWIRWIYSVGKVDSVCKVVSVGKVDNETVLELNPFITLRVKIYFCFQVK